MSSVESAQGGGEKLRWWLAIAIIIAGVAANLYFVDTYPTIVRVLMLLGGVLVGGFIGYTTTKGKNFAKFVRNANIERQKIVWPTRDGANHHHGFDIGGHHWILSVFGRFSVQ